MKRLLTAVILMAGLLCGHTLQGQVDNAGFPKPMPNALVHDYVGWLDKSEAAALNQKLIDFNDSTSNQIVIVIVDDLLGLTPNEYATRLGEEWGVGQKNDDNGVVILVKPTGGQMEREAFIAVGYGLEGAIPDITSNHIVQFEMLPRFKEGKNFDGLNAATTVLMELARGEYSAVQYEKRNKVNPFMIVFLILIIGGISFLIPFFKARQYARINHIGIWAAMALLAAQNAKKNKWDDFKGGRGPFIGGGFGGFSGGGGGGFGGFGGGGFGGGGAGGSW